MKAFDPSRETYESFLNRHDHSSELNESMLNPKWWQVMAYLFWGFLFGLLFVKAEIVSWYRIQEMFRLQSFHMYGVIGSAVVTGLISVQLLKYFKIRTLRGENIVINEKRESKGTIFGSLIFGFGWALTGACPGPMFALAGAGIPAFLVVIASAMAGVYVYGLVKHRLPD